MFSIFKRKSAKEVSLEMIIAILCSVLALVISVGTVRWSWLLLNEQIQIRKDFMKMQNDVVQMQMTFDAWDAKATAQRQELHTLIEQQKLKVPMKK